MEVEKPCPYFTSHNMFHLTHTIRENILEFIVVNNRIFKQEHVTPF